MFDNDALAKKLSDTCLCKFTHLVQKSGKISACFSDDFDNREATLFFVLHAEVFVFCFFLFVVSLNITFDWIIYSVGIKPYYLVFAGCRAHSLSCVEHTARHSRTTGSDGHSAGELT